MSMLNIKECSVQISDPNSYSVTARARQTRKSEIGNVSSKSGRLTEVVLIVDGENGFIVLRLYIVFLPVRGTALSPRLVGLTSNFQLHDGSTEPPDEQQWEEHIRRPRLECWACHLRKYSCSSFWIRARQRKRLLWSLEDIRWIFENSISGKDCNCSWSSPKPSMRYSARYIGLNRSQDERALSVYRETRSWYVHLWSHKALTSILASWSLKKLTYEGEGGVPAFETTDTVSAFPIW